MFNFVVKLAPESVVPGAGQCDIARGKEIIIIANPTIAGLKTLFPEPP